MTSLPPRTAASKPCWRGIPRFAVVIEYEKKLLPASFRLLLASTADLWLARGAGHTVLARGTCRTDALEMPIGTLQSKVDASMKQRRITN